MDDGKAVAEAFVDWMEAAISNDKVAKTPHQISVMTSVVAKSRFNMENPDAKQDMTREELACFSAAMVVFAMRVALD